MMYYVHNKTSNDVFGEMDGGIKVANYCGECALWRGSRDENKYGERYCVYSRRYEKADQNSYGCRGFVDGTRRYFAQFTVEEQKIIDEMCQKKR